MKFKSGSSTTIVQTTRAFGARGLIESVQNDWSGTSPYMVSKYAYSNDALARREYVIRTGSSGAFDGVDPRSPEHAEVWSYDDRNELTAAEWFQDTTPPVQRVVRIRSQRRPRR